MPTKVISPISTVELDIKEEQTILEGVDFVLPLKHEGILLRAVVEQLCHFYNPRRIIFVSKPEVLDRICRLIQFWDINENDRWKVVFINEYTALDSFLGRNSREILESIYNTPANSKNFCAPSIDPVNIKRREFGWWYQQIIKLGISIAVPDVSKYYVVWDCDLIPLKRWPLFMRNNVAEDILDNDTDHNFSFAAVPTVAVLQKNGKPGAFKLYCDTLKCTLDIDPAIPEAGGTFVTHHMVFNREILNKFLDTISHNCKNLQWPIAIMQISNDHLRWSEYLCYSSFASSTEYKNKLNFHPFHKYGLNGERKRNGKTFVNNVLNVIFNNRIPNGGYSIKDVKTLLSHMHGESARDKTYLQIDHVYNSVPGSTCSRCLPLLYPKTEWCNEQYRILNLWGYEIAYTSHLSDNMDHVDTVLQMKLNQRLRFWWKTFIKSNCIFIHIPKNAGTSMEYLIAPQLKKPTSQHVTALELREMWPSEFHKLFKFAIYRDPIERVISAYAYLIDGGNGKNIDTYWSRILRKFKSFDEFVECKFSLNNSQKENVKGNSILAWNRKLPTHFIPQYIFICNEKKDVLVDVLLHIEDLGNDGALSMISRYLIAHKLSSSAQKIEMTHVRVGATELKKKIASSLTPKTITILKQFYRHDYDLENRVTRVIN